MTLRKPSELNQICSTHSSFDIQRTDTTCHGKIVLPAGDSIISSSPENEVILEAHQGIVLEGNNRIGEPNKRISLRSLSVELKVNNEQASSIEDYQNKHTVIYGDLLSAYPTKLHNVLIDGDIVLTGSTLHIDGEYNTIIGKILTHSTTDIFNTNVCGTIESKAINCISRRITLSNNISSSVILWRTVLCLLMIWRFTARRSPKVHLPH